MKISEKFFELLKHFVFIYMIKISLKNLNNEFK